MSKDTAATLNLYDELSRDGLPNIEKREARVVRGPCGEFGRAEAKSSAVEESSELALAVHSYLAQHVGETVSTTGVAEAVGYNYGGVSRVMSKLRRKGVIGRRLEFNGRIVWYVTEEIRNESKVYGWTGRAVEG